MENKKNGKGPAACLHCDHAEVWLSADKLLTCPPREITMRTLHDIEDAGKTCELPTAEARKPRGELPSRDGYVMFRPLGETA